jgi:hypothetical protein
MNGVTRALTLPTLHAFVNTLSPALHLYVPAFLPSSSTQCKTRRVCVPSPHVLLQVSQFPYVQLYTFAGHAATVHGS